MRDKLAPQVGRDPAGFVAALLILYDPGAGIGWHRTADGCERRSVELPPRSLYLLSGEVRREWEHSIAPLDVTRRSITLRTPR